MIFLLKSLSRYLPFLVAPSASSLRLLPAVYSLGGKDSYGFLMDYPSSMGQVSSWFSPSCSGTPPQTCFFCITSAFDELMMENFNNKSIGKALEFSICEHLKLHWCCFMHSTPWSRPTSDTLCKMGLSKNRGYLKMWWYQSSFFLLNSCGGILRSSNTPKWSQLKTNTGWWLESLWKILVSWDYYCQYMENMFQTTNQNIYFPPCPTNIHHRRIQPFTKFRPVWLTPLLLGKFPLLEINHGMSDKNRWMWVNWSIYQTINPKSAKYQTQKRTKITKFGNWSVLWPLLHKLVYNLISL